MSRFGFSAAQLRVCILTPGHLSTNPRLVKEADALAGAGYKVQRHCGRLRSLGARGRSSVCGQAWSVAQTLPFGPDAPRPVAHVQLAASALGAPNGCRADSAPALSSVQHGIRLVRIWSARHCDVPRRSLYCALSGGTSGRRNCRASSWSVVRIRRRRFSFGRSSRIAQSTVPSAAWFALSKVAIFAAAPM